MIKQKIKLDSMKALKAGDKKRVAVLRYVLSLIDKKEMRLEVGKSLSNNDQIGVIRKELKNKKEAIDMFAKGGRDDLVTETEEEIDILSEYMPEEMSEEEVAKKIAQVVAEKGTNFGMVMGIVMKEFAGKVDGLVVSRLVKEEIDKA